MKNTGLFFINGNNFLNSIPTFNNLEKIYGNNKNGAFNITGTSITNINGFNNLISVRPTTIYQHQDPMFQIQNNRYLTDISGFNSLQSISGDILIDNNNYPLNISQSTYDRFNTAINNNFLFNNISSFSLL